MLYKILPANSQKKILQINWRKYLYLLFCRCSRITFYTKKLFSLLLFCYMLYNISISIKQFCGVSGNRDPNPDVRCNVLPHPQSATLYNSFYQAHSIIFCHKNLQGIQTSKPQNSELSINEILFCL
jgi:hypothetical protein